MNPQQYKFFIFVTGVKWTWEVLAPNGNTLCRSTRVFESRGEARRSAERFLRAIRGNKVDIEEQVRNNAASKYHFIPPRSV